GGRARPPDEALSCRRLCRPHRATHGVSATCPPPQCPRYMHSPKAGFGLIPGQGSRYLHTARISGLPSGAQGALVLAGGRSRAASRFTQPSSLTYLSNRYITKPYFFSVVYGLVRYPKF